MFNEKLFSPKSLLLFAGLAHLPIALEYTVRMWQTGHYQFFPLIILVVGWLWYQMSDELRQVSMPPDRNVFVIAIIGELGLVFVATAMNSSFIGAISMVGLFATTLYLNYGRTGLIKGLPLVFVGLFAVPLPSRIDSWLIFNLQFVASRLASQILDAFQQIHFLEGVVLRTETRGFLTEEACSGVRSLFSSLAGIAIYGVTLHYPWWRQLFNLIQTVCWVVVGNAFRVAIVVYVSDNYSDRIASGRPHEILGLIVFLLIFMLAVSTDRLYGAFVGGATDLEEEEPEVSPGVEVARPPTDQATGIREPVPNWLGFIAIPMCLVIFLFGTSLAYSKFSQNQGRGVYLFDRLPFPIEADLPRQVGNWHLVSFRHTNRGKDRLQAEDSFIWTFENDVLTALISVDCPWDEWHNLANCYSGLGWNTHSSHYFDGGDTLEVGASDFGDAKFSQLGMNKNSGETGVVLFSSIDANGQMVTPQYSSGFLSVHSVWQQFVSNVLSVLGLSGDQDTGLKRHQFPLSTIQLYCTPETEIGPTQIRELRQLFVDARKLLIESPRFKGTIQPAMIRSK